MVAIYVRQSLDKKDSLSIESQIEDCVTLCKRNGWNDYKIYKDKGWSAKNLDRPCFQEMNEDVLAGQIEAVVCYKIDRISRSIRDLVNLIEDYNELGVHFVSFADNINTAAPGGMMMATLFGSLAQMEREAIITRVTDNYYYRCELGFWGGGPAPYGYRLKKTQVNGQKHTVLEQDEKEAAVVRKFFAWYLEEDGSVYSILNRANEEHILTRKGAAWTSRVVSDLLSRPLYAPNTMDIYNFYLSQGVRMKLTPEQCDGKLSVNLFGKRDRGSKHPKRSRPASEMTFAIARHKAIIDSDTYLRVQFKKKAKLSTTPRSGTANTTILTGLVRCGSCGRAMSPSGSRNGVRYFTCSGRRNYASGTCKSTSIKVDTLETFVLSQLQEHYLTDKMIEFFRKNKDFAVSLQDSIRINTIQQDIAKIDTDIETLVNACLESNATAITYLNKKIESLDARKKELTQKLLSVRNSTNRMHNLLQDIDIDAIPDIIASDDFAAKKQLCNRLIKKITYYSKEHIQIEYLV